jgi:hypothetical protein
MSRPAGEQRLHRSVLLVSIRRTIHEGASFMPLGGDWLHLKEVALHVYHP